MTAKLDFGKPGPLGVVLRLSGAERLFVKTHLAAASCTYNVPYPIFLAQILHESGDTLNPLVLGDADIGGKILGKFASVGFGQVNTLAHPDFDVARALSPDVEYEAAYSAHFLSELYREWKSWELALHHYNGDGPAAAKYAEDILIRASELKLGGDA